MFQKWIMHSNSLVEIKQCIAPATSDYMLRMAFTKTTAAKGAFRYPHSNPGGYIKRTSTGGINFILTSVSGGEGAGEGMDKCVDLFL
jgi:hypothetical protein